MGGLVDLSGGGILAIIGLAVFGAMLLATAVGAFVVWRRRPDEPPAVPAQRGRLAVSASVPVEGGRQLVLVRRDHVEHLLLIGGPRDVVVEAGILRQRAASMAPGARPAAARPGREQSARPAAAAGAPISAPSAAPAAAPAASHAPASAVPAAQPAAPEPGAADPAVQERLRAASTALALRQAAARPGEPAQPGETARKPEAEEPAAPAAPATGAAVAGLAAGIAALTAAAGDRARAAPQGQDRGEDEAAGAEPAQGEPGPGAAAEPADAASSVTKDEAADLAGDEEPGRAVFGLRDAPPAAASAARAPAAPQAGADAASAPAPPAATPGGADGADAEAGPADKRPAVSEVPQDRGFESQESPAAAAETGDDEGPSPAEPRGAALGSVKAADAGAAAAAETATAPSSGGEPQPAAEKGEPIGHPPATPPSAAAAALPAAGRPEGAAALLSGLGPGRGTTLGDLAERLEEALIQQAASGGGGPVRPAALAEAMPPSPAAPSREEASVAELRQAEDGPPGPSASAEAAERDEAAVIDFAARRKSGSESLEEEMARLLGELTQDTKRR